MVNDKFLGNIYISPLESCNLNCRSCYTRKTRDILSNAKILRFVTRYNKHLQQMSSPSSRGGLSLKSVLFCGGEVFLLPDFPGLVNQLLSQNIFITIITNGTIDRLTEINDPSNCQLIVSLDGPQKIHDHNRGHGNFAKSLKFLEHAINLNFPIHIFYLVTKDSYPHFKTFRLSGLSDSIDLPITYLTDRLGSLTPAQILDIKQNYPTYPSKNFGCFQLALQSNGFIYGCCESSLPLASISDPIPKIIKNFQNSLSVCNKCKRWRSKQIFRAQSSEWLSYEGASTKNFVYKPKICNGCSNPNFLCDYPHQLGCQNCQQVVKLFNQ